MPPTRWWRITPTRRHKGRPDTSRAELVQNNLDPFESTQISTIPARTVTTFYVPNENILKEKVTYLNYILTKELYYICNYEKTPVKISILIITLEDLNRMYRKTSLIRLFKSKRIGICRKINYQQCRQISNPRRIA